MLTRRVIPRLDLSGGEVASGIRFLADIDPEDPVAHARAYYELGADEILLVDHTPGEESWQPQLNLIASMAAAIPIPILFGGDIKGEAAIRALLKAGADRIYLGDVTVNRPELLTQARGIWGPQRIGAMAAVKRRLGRWYVFVDGGRRSSRMDALEWAESVSKAGAGELLFTSLDTEHRQGFDLNLAHVLQESISRACLLEGGGTTPAHVVEAFEAGAQGVVAGGILHSGRVRIKDIKELMVQGEIPTRPIPSPEELTPSPGANDPVDGDADTRRASPPTPDSDGNDDSVDEALGNLWDE